ncbi:hypothetical protein ZHAS_00018770 [Anopheles sinensis]|uniref:Uncharacterized protein n=1 Tax=Anopheles sinensis TaxID=74873 RepID=A0A084WJZ2_ANOSI|nr:hypothetical protein ZHAS_00018770 [Anopheles sinensis]
MAKTFRSVWAYLPSTANDNMFESLRGSYRAVYLPLGTASNRCQFLSSFFPPMTQLDKKQMSLIQQQSALEKGCGFGNPACEKSLGRAAAGIGLGQQVRRKLFFPRGAWNVIQPTGSKDGLYRADATVYLGRLLVGGRIFIERIFPSFPPERPEIKYRLSVSAGGPYRVRNKAVR